MQSPNPYPDDPTVKFDAERGAWRRGQPTRMVIFPDGQTMELGGPMRIAEIAELICNGTGHTGLDTVNLRDADGHVMLVHDLGHPLALPVNPGATAIYRQRAPEADHVIRGIAVVVPDEDFAP